MPDYNDIFPLSCNSFKALNRHMGSNEINNWITSICSVVLSCMQRSAIFSFLVSIFVLKRSCLCSKTIVDLKTNFLVFRRSKLKDSQNSCKRYIDAFLFYFHTIFSYKILLFVYFFFLLLWSHSLRNAKNLKINIPKNREQCGSNCRSVDKLI